MRRLSVESLEQRTLLSAAPMSVAVDPVRVAVGQTALVSAYFPGDAYGLVGFQQDGSVNLETPSDWAGSRAYGGRYATSSDGTVVPLQNVPLYYLIGPNTSNDWHAVLPNVPGLLFWNYSSGGTPIPVLAGNIIDAALSGALAEQYYTYCATVYGSGDPGTDVAEDPASDGEVLFGGDFGDVHLCAVGPLNAQRSETLKTASLSGTVTMTTTHDETQKLQFQ